MNNMDVFPMSEAPRAVFWATGDPEQRKAHYAVKKALDKGLITRPNACERCGDPAWKWKLQAHHPDYTKPLAVIWLCTPCHVEIHPKKGSVGGGIKERLRSI